MTIMNFISANKKCLVIMIACGAALLLAAAVAVVVASRNRQQPAPLPDVPAEQTPAVVRVKAVERKTGPVEQGEVAAASGAVAIVCGEDAAPSRSGAARTRRRPTATRRGMTRLGRLRVGGTCRRRMSRR